MLYRYQIGVYTQDQCYANLITHYYIRTLLKEQELFYGFEKKQDQCVFHSVCFYIASPEFQGTL